MVSEETREKIRQKLLGRPLSEETILKLRELKKGKSSHNAKTVLNLETGIYYDSIEKAAYSLNMKSGTLLSMLNRRTRNKTSVSLV